MSEINLEALVTLLQPQHMAFLCLGTLIGLIVGILPGLGGIAGLSLLLPFVFGGDSKLVLPMMIGMLAVTNTSDTFPAVLLLSVLSHFLVLSYPRGVLQTLMEMPRPFD